MIADAMRLEVEPPEDRFELRVERRVRGVHALTAVT
jgi:hypothetical protein